VFSKRTLFATSAILLVAAAAVGLIVWKKRSASVAEERGTVAVLAFENLTGAENLDWAQRLVPFSVARQLSAMRSSAVIVAADRNEARAWGARHLVSGYLSGRAQAPTAHYVVEDAATGRAVASGEVAMGAMGWEGFLNDVAARVAQGANLQGRLDPAEFHNEKAARLYSEGLSSSDAAEAARKFQAATAADLSCGWCWQAWAERAAATGGPQAMEQVLARSKEQTVHLSPLSRARLDLMAAFAGQDLKKIRSALEAYTARQPNDDQALAQLGDANTALRDYTGAAAAYRRAIDAAPSRADFWNSYAYALAYQGKYDDAMRAAAEYTKRETRSANPLDSVGELALMAGRFPLAVGSFLECHGKDKDFNGGSALEKAALARLLEGDSREAAGLLEGFLRERAARGDAWAEVHQARWEQMLGQTSLARKRLSALTHGSPDSVAQASAVLLCLYALDAGDEPGARRAAAELSAPARAGKQPAAFALAALNPDDPPRVDDASAGAQARATGYTLRGDWPKASEAWREALRLSRGGIDAPQREMLAYCLVRQGQSREAAKLVSARWPVLTADQSLLYSYLLFPNVFFTRAEIARFQGNGSEAQRNYDLFLQYAGDRKDRFGDLARARSQARL
jgi:cytochrome c-type biogenesis protein CcmH